MAPTPRPTSPAAWLTDSRRPAIARIGPTTREPIEPGAAATPLDGNRRIGLTLVTRLDHAELTANLRIIAITEATVFGRNADGTRRPDRHTALVRAPHR